MYYFKVYLDVLKYDSELTFQEVILLSFLMSKAEQESNDTRVIFITISDIAKSLNFDRRNTTRMLLSLERKKYIIVGNKSRGRSSTNIYITPKNAWYNQEDATNDILKAFSEKFIKH